MMPRVTRIRRWEAAPRDRRRPRRHAHSATGKKMPAKAPAVPGQRGGIDSLPPLPLCRSGALYGGRGAGGGAGRGVGWRA